MHNIKKAALGLKSKPSPVGDIRFPKQKIDSKKTDRFSNIAPKVDSITIKKNDDYKKLPF